MTVRSSSAERPRTERSRDARVTVGVGDEYRVGIRVGDAVFVWVGKLAVGVAKSVAARRAFVAPTTGAGGIGTAVTAGLDVAALGGGVAVTTT